MHGRYLHESAKIVRCRQVRQRRWKDVRFFSLDTTESIPRLDARTLQPGFLIEEVKSPIILTNIAESWPAKYLWSVDYLAKVHGHHLLTVLSLPDELYEEDDNSPEVGNSLYADHVRNAYVPFVRIPKKMRLSDYVKYNFRDYVFDLGDDGLAKHLSVDAFGSVADLPKLFSADDLVQLSFGMGPASDGVMFHAHTAAWNALVFGEKDWFFFAPNRFVGESYEKLSMASATSLMKKIDGVDASASQTVMRCRQYPGEVVYIPDGWWHATISLTNTACLGGQRHKDRLPSTWAKHLLKLWPDSGLFLNAVAKQEGDLSLFEAAMKQEPFNLRFVVEYMTFLRQQGQYTKSVEEAYKFRGAMEKIWRDRLLGRAEFAAVIAQLAEVLFHTVEYAAAAYSKVDGKPMSAHSGFNELLQVSIACRSLTEEALGLDKGCLLAGSLAKTIHTRAQSAKSADLSSLPVAG